MSSVMALGTSVEVPYVDLPSKERELGELRATFPEGRRALPLAGVSIKARVAERVAEVVVEQRFQNPYAEALEATYIFPLAGGAAVSRFELQVGARVLKGRVDERAEARRQYQVALEQGRRAALLEQERDDVFTVQVGNLPPGEEVIVRIAYAEKLPFFENGMTELRLPTVVAPRYIGGHAIDTPEQAGRGTADDTDRVPDASRISPPRLAKGFDPKVSLELSVELLHAGEKGVPGLTELFCSQHATRMSTGPETALVQLARTEEPLDRDFVLRWRLGGAQVESTLLVHRESEGQGFALLSIVPPRREGFLGVPRDIVFVVDRSGSMGGEKMVSAARACSQLLATLGPRDRFAVQAFDDVVEWMDGKPVLAPGDLASIARGDKWLRAIEARNGTELDNALGAALAALAARTEAAGRAGIVVLLTDGEVGDESSALRRAQSELGAVRLFTVGIDTAVNDGFLKRLAALGGGTSAFVEPGTALEDALRAVGREIGAPLIVDLKVEDVDAGVVPSSAAPSRLPDLFEGRAAAASFSVTRKLSKSTIGSVRITGRYADGKPFEQVVAARELTLPALGHVWARTRAADLEDEFRVKPAERERLKKEIVELAIAHTLLTRFTAFVVVDQSEVVNKHGARRQVTQPVEMPAGWERHDVALPPASPQFSMSGAGGQSASPAMAIRSRAFSGSAPAAPSASASVDLDSALDDAAAAPSPVMKKASLFSKLKGALLATPTAHKSPVPPAVAADVEKLRELLGRLRLALTAIATGLAQGRVPPAAELDAARTELLKLLAQSSVAVRLGELQKLARVTLFAQVAALQDPKADAKSLAALFAQGEAQLAAAEKQLAEVLGAPGGAAFWEASI